MPIDPNDPVHESNDSSELGYEHTDVNIPGVVVFLLSLVVFLGVFFIFCYAMGKVINNQLAKQDGPLTKWTALQQPNAGKAENMQSNPAEEQQQLSELTQRFPTPRLQNDDGNQDVADLHAREDLLLEHYSWVDRSQGKVRIPIERAMELIAQRGLPVAPATQTQEPLMTADQQPYVQMPLTTGYARTGYEQEQENAAKAPAEVAAGASK
jgi:hypothetical protein